MGYNLLIDGVYCGYNPLTNLLLTSWDILVAFFFGGDVKHFPTTPGCMSDFDSEMC